MTETKTATPVAATVEPPKTRTQKLTRWVTIGAGIILGLIGILKVYNAFTPQLPSCGSDDVSNLVRDIFKKKDVALTALNDFKTVADGSQQRDCTAHLETASEKATVFYRLTLQGKEFNVLITKVDTAP
ncbi:MAG: hypothetical protein ACREB2_01070 [Pseudolabrys sp.]